MKQPHPASTSHTSCRQRGGQSANKNALKHGLYARHYTPRSRLDLQEMPPLESLPEIHMLRLQLDDLLTLIRDCDDEDRRIKLYNALFTGTQRLTAAMRTHTLLVGKDQQLLTTFWEALELFRQERGL